MFLKLFAWALDRHLWSKMGVNFVTKRRGALALQDWKTTGISDEKILG